MGSLLFNAAVYMALELLCASRRDSTECADMFFVLNGFRCLATVSVCVCQFSTTRCTWASKKHLGNDPVGHQAACRFVRGPAWSCVLEPALPFLSTLCKARACQAECLQTRQHSFDRHRSPRHSGPDWQLSVVTPRMSC